MRRSHTYNKVLHGTTGSGREAAHSRPRTPHPSSLTQTESQESNAISLASGVSTEEMETALCSLTEALFASLLDVTLQRVLQAEVVAPTPAGSAGCAEEPLPSGAAAGQTDASGSGSDDLEMAEDAAAMAAIFDTATAEPEDDAVCCACDLTSSVLST